MSHRFSPAQLHKVNLCRSVSKLGMVFVALLLSVGPLMRPGRVEAQISSNPCPIPKGQGYIVQDCPRWGHLNFTFSDPAVGLYLQQLESQAIDEIMVRHRLSGAADRQRLLTWERDLIRAALFDKVLGVIQKPAAQRSAIEQKVVDALTNMVQKPRIDSTEKALDYYNAWAADPCKWKAPPEFDDYSVACSPLGNLWGGPKPPDFEQFQAYGAYAVLKDLDSNQPLQNVAGGTGASLSAIRGYSYAAGLPAAALAGSAIGSQLASSGLIIRSIYPFYSGLLEKAAGKVVAEVTARIAAKASTAAVRGASTIGFVATTVIATVITAVLEGIAVFKAEGLPDELRGAISYTTNNPPNLTELIKSEQGLQELYFPFLRLTLPDYPPTQTLPGQEAANGLFRFYNSAGARIAPTPNDRTIRYFDWIGLRHTAWTDGGWFVDEYTDENNAIQRRLTLDLNYISADGTGWTAWRTGAQFMNTQPGDDNKPFVYDSLTFLNANKALSTVAMPAATPALAIVPTHSTQLRRAYTADFAFPDGETRYYWTVEGSKLANTQRVPGKVFTYDFAAELPRGPLGGFSASSSTFRVKLEAEAVLNGVVVSRQQATISEVINNSSPVVEKATIASPSGAIREGDPVIVRATFADDSDEFTCEVDFGDRSGRTRGVVTGKNCSATHAYAVKGKYEPKVYVSDRQYVSYNYAPVVTVVPSPPAITNLRLRYDNASGKVVLDIDFSDVDQQRHLAQIDWGDGQTWPGVVAGGVRAYSKDHAYNVGLNRASVFVTLWDWDELSDRKGVGLSKPTISGAAELTVAAGQPISYTVRGGGSPLPGFTVEGTLPNGVRLVNNNDGTASLAGTPAPGSAGQYRLKFVALNGTTLPPAALNFTLSVTDAPAIVSANKTTFYTQQNNSFDLALRGAAPHQVTVLGALPRGVFFSNVNGAAGLGGAPAAGSEGVYRITFNIVKDGVTVASQPFVLTVVTGSAPPPWANIQTTRYVFATPTVTMTFNGFSQSNIPIIGFECALDDVTRFSACASPHAMTIAGEGVTHTFYVRAVDQRGVKTNPPVSRTFEVRLPPRANPQQAPAANAAGWNNGDVTVTWNWTDDSRFGRGCPSTSVSSGEGTLPLVATCGDVLGATATVTRTVKVDKSAPETTLSAPTSNNRDITVAFAGTDATSGVVSFACSLDNAVFTPCASPQTYSGLADGQHTVAVRAVDAAGNADASPASYSWTVGTANPTATPSATPSATVTPSATATPNATATPAPDDTLIGSCGNYTVYRNAQGQYHAAGWNGAINVGTNTTDKIHGTDGPDLMLGLGGDDTLDGKAGDDVLCGGDGNDLLHGGDGNDLLDGGAGNDKLHGGAGDYDQLMGGEGSDLLRDSDGVSMAQGGAGNDTIALSLRAGWRDASGQPRFTGLAAGYGDDEVEVKIHGNTRVFVDITGDERDNPASALEGKQDVLALSSHSTPDSVISKFERRVAHLSNSDTSSAVADSDTNEDNAATPASRIFLPMVSQ